MAWGGVKVLIMEEGRLQWVVGGVGGPEERERRGRGGRGGVTRKEWYFGQINQKVLLIKSLGTK